MTDPVFAEYNATQLPIAVARMDQIEALVRSIEPSVVPAISYGIPTFKLNGKNLVHWAGWPKHVGFYPGAACIAKFSPEFEGLKYAKGSVQFPHTQPLPVDLIERMVRFRLNPK